MSQSKIVPDKVTRPFQLLAAWLTGLTIINSSFLFTATQIKSPSWGSGLLIIASVVNVPVFLTSIFLLQTKFRPEMQEDSYYAKYLETRYSVVNSPRIDVESRLHEITQSIIKEINPSLDGSEGEILKIVEESQVEQVAYLVGDSRSLSELYLEPAHWSSIANEWETHDSFREDVQTLIKSGVVRMDGNDYATSRLTEFGKKVAKFSEEKKLLFALRKGNRQFWKEQH